MSRVLGGEYDSIRLEPPGPEGEGVEFWLRRGDSREYHQVKRQGARRGHWTLGELRDNGVLTAFRKHLANNTATCVFVSSQDAFGLRNLAERARDAADHEEFKDEFAQGEWNERFSELLAHWPGCSSAEGFSLLKRIHVHTIDEEMLRLHAELRLESVVEGDTCAATDVLFVHALDSVHKELDRGWILNHLQCRGFTQPIWAAPKALSEVVEKANERFLVRLRDELIRGELIQRGESECVLAALQEGSTKRGAIVTGGAGSGKSTVLLQVIESLEQQNIPTLAFRIDNLTPTQSPNEAGRQIELPKSPVATLAAMANGRPCVLILDQLDAVSLISGRNPTFFECFDEMVRQALMLPAMRLVIACRRFDFENDHRLRRLGGHGDVFENVEVGTLSGETVRHTVNALGIDPSRIGDKQVELLSVPAHLKLLCEVAPGKGAILDFDTANELYGLYWERKDRLLRAKLGSTVTWLPVIDRLCEYMSNRQALSAPAINLDDVAAIRDALLSEHVLVQDGARVNFFHEGFFDYAFARRFAATDGDLMGLLRSDEQHLFRRAQVRQILLHQREIDRPLYAKNVNTLLTSADIRFHIKQLVFALLAQFTDPTEAEWRILEELLRDSDYSNRDQIWFATRTLPWFRLLDSLHVVENWLKQNDSDRVDRAVTLLHGVQRDAADRVAELVEPYVGTSPEWRNRYRYLVQWADLQAGRRFFELFLRLLDYGDLDGIGGAREGDLLSILYELSKSRADWACEAIGHYLARCMRVSLDSGETNPFKAKGGSRYSHSSDRVLIGSAERAPSAFIEHVLPFVLRVIELNASQEGEKPWEDTVWRWRFQDWGHGIDDHLLRATDEALSKLAREAPNSFERIARPLRKSEYETVQFLLMRAYAATGERFADEAIDYLCEHARRLRCGYFDAGLSHRASRDLIQAATPHCSTERLANLEAILLGYYTNGEQTADGRQRRGETQFDLLLAIDHTRRSASVQARIGEWQRKFCRKAPAQPARSGMCFVGSPISAKAVEKMNDEQWLGALARYSSRELEWRDGAPVGGPHELGQMLEAQVKKDPARFARLVLSFPDGTNPAYFQAVLRGLGSSTENAQGIFEACRHCYRLANRPAGLEFCRLAEKIPELPWPEDLLGAIAWYATEDPDPDHESWRTEASGGRCYYGGDIYTAGINCVRGTAAGALRALLSADTGRLPRFLPTLRRMVRDPSIAVRSCVATTLLPVLSLDRDLAVALFSELCETEDVLLKTHYMEKFMRYATATHFEQLRPHVERMLCSSDSEVAQVGARRACIASFDREDVAELRDKCVSGSESLRLGAAQVFAANVGDARFCSVCEAELLRFFDDPSDKVRDSAAACFDHLDNDALGHVPGLMVGFQSSAAFEAYHEHLIRALEETTAQLPDVTISVCERFIEIAGSAAGDMRTRAASDAHRLSDLIIRAYHQAGDGAVRERCLDTIDNLLRVGATGLQEALSEFER